MCSLHAPDDRNFSGFGGFFKVAGSLFNLIKQHIEPCDARATGPGQAWLLGEFRSVIFLVCAGSALICPAKGVAMSSWPAPRLVLQ